MNQNTSRCDCRCICCHTEMDSWIKTVNTLNFTEHVSLPIFEAVLDSLIDNGHIYKKRERERVAIQ